MKWNILNTEDEIVQISSNTLRDFELVVLSFGSNKGNRYNYIKKAIKTLSLSGDFNLIAVSNLYETEPWGFKNQKKFLNCTGAGLTRLTPVAFLRLIKKTELELGRLYKYKWQEREIDIDILFFGSRVLSTEQLIIPHPRLHKRNFVLFPLKDIMPEFMHPVLRKTVIQLLKLAGDTAGVKLLKRQILDR